MPFIFEHIDLCEQTFVFENVLFTSVVCVAELVTRRRGQHVEPRPAGRPHLRPRRRHPPARRATPRPARGPRVGGKYPNREPSLN